VSTQLACGRDIDDLVAAQLAPAAAVGGGAAAPDMNAVMQIFGGLMTATEMTSDLAKTIGRQAVEAPTGSEDAWVGSFDAFMGVDGWPADRDLRVVALSTSTGERRVWTKADGVPVQRAVASSCAVPGLFPPVTIDGDRYTDGGAWSPSNADLLAGEGLDAVLFIGPIGTFLAGPRPQVELELEQVAAKGARTGSLLPGPSFESLRTSLMDPAFRAQGVEAGRADGTAAAARVREVLGG
jgi:NTE family protein